MQLLGYLVVGLLSGSAALVGLSAWQRLRLARDPAWFRCRLGRVSRRPWRREKTLHWSACSTRARWVHDVLLVQVGVLRVRTIAVHVQLPAEARVDAAHTDTPRRLGSRPQSLRIAPGDGSWLDVAVSYGDRTRLVGPFLAAAIPGLPTAPTERRRRR